MSFMVHRKKFFMTKKRREEEILYYSFENFWWNKMEYFPDSESLMNMKNLDYQILSTFYMKHKRLEEAHRKDLARVIITSIFEKNPETRLTTDQFIYLSQIIVSVFETEVKETYYIPSKKSSSPKGKLYSQYNNYREKMYDVGLITRNAREKTKANEPQLNEMIKIEKP